MYVCNAANLVVYFFPQSVQRELHTTTEAKAELERKFNDLLSQRSKDVAGRTASEWKQMEEEKKVRIYVYCICVVSACT